VQVVHEAQQPVFNIVVAQLPSTGTHLSKYTARFLPLTPFPKHRWGTLGTVRQPFLQSSFFSLSVLLGLAFSIHPSHFRVLSDQTTIYLHQTRGPAFPTCCTAWKHFESSVSHSINLFFKNFSHWASQRTCLGRLIQWWT